MKFKLHSIDTGFCRVYYTTRNESNERIIYCIQDNGKEGVELYRCSRDGEPSHPVKFKEPLQNILPLFKNVYPIPEGNERRLIELCNEYILGAL
jgi:hypothetical protein